MRKKIGAFALGLIFLLILMELALRFVGSYDTAQREEVAASGDGEVTVLCVGNSHTAGAGAPIGMSYPSQLYKILNEKGKKRYRVVNKGVSNINSTYIASNLPKWLEEVKPDFVFIMAGEPNSWNKFGYHEFLKEKDKTNSSILLFLDESLRKFKLFKFFEVLAFEFKKNENSIFFVNVSKKSQRKYLGYLWAGYLGSWPPGQLHLDRLSKKEIEEAIEFLTYIYEKDQSPLAARILSEIHLHIGGSEIRSFFFYAHETIRLHKYFNYNLWMLLKNHKNRFILTHESEYKILNDALLRMPLAERREEALKWNADWKNVVFNTEEERSRFFFDMLSIAPEYFSYYNMFEYFKHDKIKVMDTVENSLLQNPLSTTVNLLGFVEEFARTFPPLKPRYDALISKLKGRLEIEEIEEISREKSEDQWLYRDLNQMLSVIKKANAKAIVQTYPRYRDGKKRPVDILLEKWSLTKPHDVIFMDVGKMMESQLSPAHNGHLLYSTMYGPEDQHLNEKGYNLLAKLMAPYVLN